MYMPNFANLLSVAKNFYAKVINKQNFIFKK